MGGVFESYEDYNALYGIIEGHRRWEMNNLRPSVFLGVGLGSYETFSEEYNFGSHNSRGSSGIGLAISAGVQLESRRLMGGVRLYRAPGLGRFVTVVDVGYQPKNYKEALGVARAGAAIAAVMAMIILVGVILILGI